MLLIVALDGATWDVIDPLIGEGRMPNLARLKQHGVWGPLASTMPPVTFPSWTSFMTGVNPGKHGVFDFTRRELGTYKLRFVNSTFRKAPTIWSRLSAHMKRVCVLGVPATYPPEPINGCMISGFDSPVATSADRSFVWPPELFAEVEEAGGFPFADFQEFRISEGWYAKALASLHAGIETKLALAKRLLAKEAWDCFCILFGESDTVSHHFWQFHDPQSPRFAAAAAQEHSGAINSIYEALDAALGSLWRAVPDADVLVVSDHGFGGSGAKAVYLNRWLEGLGWLTREPASLASHSVARARNVALRVVPTSWQQKLFRMFQGRVANLIETRSRFSGIAWQGTKAFSEELNYFPSLWVNLRGREPDGQVDAQDYDRVCEELCSAASALADPETGAPIVRKAWRREELYDGPWMRYAPDIVLEYNLDAGYSYMTLPSGAGDSVAPVCRLQRSATEAGKGAGMSGSHRKHGIFAASGPRVPQAGFLHGLRIEDAAPTILTLCGVDCPKEFDGRNVLLGVHLGECSICSHHGGQIERRYQPEEEDEIAARLANLGYIG